MADDSVPAELVKRLERNGFFLTAENSIGKVRYAINTKPNAEIGVPIISTSDIEKVKLMLEAWISGFSYGYHRGYHRGKEGKNYHLVIGGLT